MRQCLFALFLCCLAPAALAQPLPERLDRVPRLQLDAAAVRTAIAELQQQPRRFAVARDLAATTADGDWDQAADGRARWRLRIASETAHSLSFRLRELRLPADAELWLYGADGSDAQGPFRAGDPLRYTPIVRGGEAVIEARMPAEQRAQFAIAIAQVFHGFRELSPAIAGKSFGNTSGISSSCNVDAACPAGNNWRNEIRSAVLLTIDNQTLCSGTLINNAARDDRALVLTANHCGLSAANVADSYAYFNVQRAACGSGAYGSVTQNIAGKTLLASSASGGRTDFALFELRSKPPASYNVQYAGWDAGSAVPLSGVGIHHPEGDDKKISVYSGASAVDRVCIGTSISGSACLGGFYIDSWSVIWAQGMTEGGSSGSGLWNQDHRVVGTLSGGSTSCSGNTVYGSDYYARLDVAWTASSATGVTLRSVLAPNGSTCLRLDGKNTGTASAASCDASGNAVSSTPSSGNSAADNSAAGGSNDGGGGGATTPLLLLPLLLLALRRRQRR